MTLRNTGYTEVTSGVCMTLVYPELTLLQGLVVESVSTVALMMINCAAWDARNANNSDSNSLKIGFAVTALSIAGVKLIPVIQISTPKKKKKTERFKKKNAQTLIARFESDNLFSGIRMHRITNSYPMTIILIKID